ncbi:MAG TPA: protein translocase subunit SecF [Pyrinomonadaceae bacterium]|jgi:preprotein translocase subunit SecF
MIEIFHKINVDWMGKRHLFIALSVVILLAGLASSIGREVLPGGTDAFNLGVDFQGGTVVTAKFREKPADEQIRTALQNANVSDAVIQNSLDKQDEVLIKVPLIGATENASAEEQRAQVDAGRARVKQALDTFGKEAAVDLGSEPDAVYKIVGTDAVGAIAGSQLRNQAVAVTLLGLLGILLFIGFRYDWTYGMGAIIAVLHDVLITLAFFSIFQWEIDLTVIAALLTLVGFSVNDTIVIFDRIRENLSLNRKESLYTLTNAAINQTMSRTVITGGLVFLSVLALVLFGGEVLRGFSLALFVGVITGTYSTIAIASPIALWWEKMLNLGRPRPVEPSTTFASSAKRGGVARQPKAENLTKAARP